MVCLACTTVLLGPDPSFKVEQAISQPCRAAKRLTGFAVRHDPPRFLARVISSPYKSPLAKTAGWKMHERAIILRGYQLVGFACTC